MWKTAFLKQTAEMPGSYEYAIIHVNPIAETLQERLSITGELKDLLRELPGDVGTAVRLIVLAVSSEGITKTRIGRHSWAHVRAMWNMSRKGFKNSTTRYLR